MTPVIRISDEVFRRLQQHSTPLVDTPNTVIERLLDQAEGTGGVGAARTSSPPPAPPPAVVTQPVVPTPSTGRASRGVFLAPASEENIRRTVARKVSLSQIDGRLDSGTLARLKLLLGGRTEFNVWAMTASSRGTYDNMRQGDLVLFAPRATGRFTYQATIGGKIESRELGQLLWPIDPEHPWSLVYLLDDVQRISLSKERLVAEFSYDRSFRVYGITRVNPERVRSAVARRGSLENVLKASAA